MDQVEQFNADMPVGQRAQAILSRALYTVRAAPGECALFMAGTAGLGIVVDLNGWAENGASLAINIASIALGYVMTAGMLTRSGLAPDGLKNGFGTYFGISLLSGIAILVGLVVLIIPGLFLICRWAPAAGYGLAKGNNASGALSDSWHATDGHLWPILVANIVPSVLLVGGLLLFVGTEIAPPDWAIISIIFGNIGIQASTMASAAVGVAVFGLLEAPRNVLGEVFE